MRYEAYRRGTMLEIRDIHTYYGDSHILQGISLGMERGQVVGILGRNGMGKNHVNSLYHRLHRRAKVTCF
jgi:ABC-type branched-subunit amino acid transport system ATPase component